MLTNILRMTRGLLDRLRDLGRRIGDALDELGRPADPRQPVPVRVPVEGAPVRRRAPR